MNGGQLLLGMTHDVSSYRQNIFGGEFGYFAALGVDCIDHRFTVLRVYTSPLSTQMVKFMAFRYGTIFSFPVNDVSLAHFSKIENLRIAATVPSTERLLPNPAWRFIATILLLVFDE